MRNVTKCYVFQIVSRTFRRDESIAAASVAEATIAHGCRGNHLIARHCSIVRLAIHAINFNFYSPSVRCTRATRRNKMQQFQVFHPSFRARHPLPLASDDAQCYKMLRFSNRAPHFQRSKPTVATAPAGATIA
jgi:hypothetical protein